MSRAPARLPVRVGDAAYDLVVGEGVLAAAGEHLPPDVTGAEVLAVISDAAVDALHGEALRGGLAGTGARVERFTIEPGEGSKDVAGAGALWRWLAASGVHRADAVVALGGGVVGDLAGFAAATYHRGIAWVNVPTTLLAQVDAAIGGKTAIDLPEGKNLVGAFHRPRAVLADVSVLATLPERAFATGLAEVIKHGLIAPVDLLDRLERDRQAIAARDPGALADLVAAAAAVKIEVVAADEREQGRRAHLNYGHTLGHALEALGGYAGLSHGEAVAIGMVFAAELAHAIGFEDLRALHRDTLASWGLPTGGAARGLDEVLAAMRTDKKYERGQRFVLLEKLGAPVVVGDLDPAAVRAAYEAVR